MNEVTCYEPRQFSHEPIQESDTNSNTMDLGSGRVVAKIVKMRTYQDRYILSQLQKEAIGENPGFQPIHESTHRAKIVWVGEGRNRQPAGYYIYCEQHFEYIKTLGREVCYPATFSQVYVIRQQRRMGLATMMMRDFIKSHGQAVVWVESPKYETRMLLGKLGYGETERPYELWEMVEGLSRWSRVVRRSNKPVQAEKKRSDSANTGMETLILRIASQHG